MRMIISPSVGATVSARQAYIFDTIRLWTRVVYSAGAKYTILESVPPQDLDIIIVVGHNSEVEHYINTYLDEISESVMVLIMCSSSVHISRTQEYGKKVYVSRQDKNETSELYNGGKYGFDFNPTESELIFYLNAHVGDVLARIEDAFTRVY